MKIYVISKLLHYANRTRFDKRIVRFYDVKNKLLKQYGKLDRHDLQFIDGKKCYSCDGTGLYHHYYSGFKDMCYNCYSGWYKRPFWSLLEVIKLGNYTFHQPKEKLYKKPENLEVSVNGYIKHEEPKYGFLAMLLILFIYDRKSMRMYFHTELSNGWRTEWWKPYNFILNVFHLIKRKHKSIPAIRIKNYIRSKFKKKEKYFYNTPDTEDLPF